MSVSLLPGIGIKTHPISLLKRPAGYRSSSNHRKLKPVFRFLLPPGLALSSKQENVYLRVIRRMMYFRFQLLVTDGRLPVNLFKTIRILIRPNTHRIQWVSINPSPSWATSEEKTWLNTLLRKRDNPWINNKLCRLI